MAELIPDLTQRNPDIYLPLGQPQEERVARVSDNTFSQFGQAIETVKEASEESVYRDIERAKTEAENIYNQSKNRFKAEAHFTQRVEELKSSWRGVLAGREFDEEVAKQVRSGGRVSGAGLFPPSALEKALEQRQLAPIEAETELAEELRRRELLYGESPEEARQSIAANERRVEEKAKYEFDKARGLLNNQTASIELSSRIEDFGTANDATLTQDFIRGGRELFSAERIIEHQRSLAIRAASERANLITGIREYNRVNQESPITVEQQDELLKRLDKRTEQSNDLIKLHSNPEYVKLANEERKAINEQVFRASQPILSAVKDNYGSMENWSKLLVTVRNVLPELSRQAGGKGTPEGKALLRLADESFDEMLSVVNQGQATSTELKAFGRVGNRILSDPKVPNGVKKTIGESFINISEKYPNLGGDSALFNTNVMKAERDNPRLFAGQKKMRRDLIRDISGRGYAIKGITSRTDPYGNTIYEFDVEEDVFEPSEIRRMNNQLKAITYFADDSKALNESYGVNSLEEAQDLLLKSLKTKREVKEVENTWQEDFKEVIGIDPTKLKMVAGKEMTEEEASAIINMVEEEEEEKNIYLDLDIRQVRSYLRKVREQGTKNLTDEKLKPIPRKE